MRAYQFPSQIKYSTFEFTNFLGVDFTTHPSEVDPRRSPDSINMVSGQEGSIDKRTGVEIEYKFDHEIYSMYQNDWSDSSGTYRVFMVHSGTGLYFLKSDSSNEFEQVLFNDTLVPLELEERRSYFISIPNNQSFMLLVGANDNDKIIMLKLYVSSGSFKVMAYDISEDGSTLDDISVYVPTTSISRTPAGIGEDYEGTNMINKTRKNAFYSTSTDTVYKLNANVSSVGSVKQMQTDGSFTTNLHNSSGGAITYTVNTVNKTVTFSAVPHVSYTEGVDNIIIEFDSTEDYDTSFLGSARVFATFGLNGGNNYLFMGGFSDNKASMSGREYWCKIDYPIYFSKNNFTENSTAKVMGYSRLGEYLVVHKHKYLDQPTVLLRSADLDADNEIIFPTKIGVSGVDALSIGSFATLRDDPLWLSEFGVTALTTSNITGVQYSQDRGFYIRDRLLNEQNLDKSISFVWDNKYFLCINNHVYVADPRYKTTEKRSYSESYQYDWFYWEGLDIKSFSIYGSSAYFGSSDGHVYRLKNKEDNYAYCDQSDVVATDWEVGIDYVVGNIVHDIITLKYYVCIKDHTSNSIVTTISEKYWKPVIAHEGSYQVPITAYWTTPLTDLGNITAKKTLKNLWVKFVKYQNMSARIYYSTKGITSLVLDEYDGYFDFNHVNFERFTFSMDSDPSVMVTNRPERKFMSIQFKIESRDEFPAGLLSIVGKYTTNSQYRG